MEVKVTNMGNPPPYNDFPIYNTNPTYPQPIEAQRVSGCFERNQKNKPQSNSAGAVALVLVCGGMNVAWSVGFGFSNYFHITRHFKCSWFIAAIVGAIIGAVLCNRLRKKISYFVASALVIIEGILLLTLYSNYDAVIVARYIDGFANGLILVPLIVMVGEESVKSMRGVIAATVEIMCFTLGLYMQIIYSASLDDNTVGMDVSLIQGILCIIYGLISLIITYFLVVESPIYYLVRGNEQAAIDSLRRLQRPFIVTTETYLQLMEHQKYIAMNKDMTFKQSAIAGLPALIKLFLFRGLIALTFSDILNSAFIWSTTNPKDIYSSIWTLIVYATLRCLGVLISALFLDNVGRRKPILLGSVICGGIAIGIAVIFNESNLDFTQMKVARDLFFVFQFFAGVFIAASSAYLCEAFPLAIKPYYIATAISIQMIVHIVCCTVELFGPAFEEFAAYIFTLAGLLFAFFVFCVFYFPETKFTNLLEAQQKFRSLQPQAN